MNEQQLAKFLKLKQEKAAEKEARILDEKAKLQRYYSQAILNLLPEIKADAKMVYMCNQAGVKFPTYINIAKNPDGVKFYPSRKTSGAFGLIRLSLDSEHPYAFKNCLGWGYLSKWFTCLGVVCTPEGELVLCDLDRGRRDINGRVVAPEQYKEFYLKYLEFHKEFHEFLESLE